MSTTERDSTDDWILPAAARPVTIHELEQRVDVALAVARSAEAAAVEIGGAAIDAAEQARRAAEFAERAVSGEPELLPLPADNGAEPEPGANGVGGDGVFAVEVVANGIEAPAEQDRGEGEDERLRLFSERADRVMTRLRALEPA